MTAIYYPDQLKREDYDAYLERGWRSTGQAVYSCDYLRTDDDELYGVLQVRLPLQNFRFKKRHRKLLRRNAKYLRTGISKAPFYPRHEFRAVNQAYAELHPTKTRDDLEYHTSSLFYDGRPLDTRQSVVRDGATGQLLGFSFFDVGRTRMYSKCGIYRPEARHYSLGTYTMLLEIQFALDNGFEYYHPGYISPGYPAFDYKLRFGPMEYFEIGTRTWQPLGAEWPESSIVTVRRHLQAALPVVTQYFPKARLYEYVSFTARFQPHDAGLEMLDAPVLINLPVPGPGGPDTGQYVLIYDPRWGRYQIVKVSRTVLYDMRAQPYSQQGVPRYTTPLRSVGVVFEATTPEELLDRMVVRNLK